MMQITVTWDIKQSDTKQSETKQSESVTVQQFKELLAGDRAFTRIQLVQEGIPNIISTMYVTIVPSYDVYTITITGTGYITTRTARRSDVYKTLLDGYGLWKL